MSKKKQKVEAENPEDDEEANQIKEKEEKQLGEAMNY